MYSRIIFYSFCLFATCQAIGRTQSTAIEGVLLCEDKPAKDVLIKLYDHDTVSPDELMDSAKTDADGHFRLSGTADEISGIEPKINIYHDCDDGILPCQRRITIFIPSKYVSNTKQPSETFNLGRLQLAGKYAGESRDCLH
ncbi:CRE-TTR-7 protein [Caenorhabditis remanei]|uniref:CRE-TTR-7 protein n=1 Tax=Caenorhabditis remanei TaxID=31234 RepID=E3MLA6_CAERE|nr:CRE-TTR-7 protein [Caenorhabditis remanei]